VEGAGVDAVRCCHRPGAESAKDLNLASVGAKPSAASSRSTTQCALLANGEPVATPLRQWAR